MVGVTTEMNFHTGVTTDLMFQMHDQHNEQKWMCVFGIMDESVLLTFLYEDVGGIKTHHEFAKDFRLGYNETVYRMTSAQSL